MTTEMTDAPVTEGAVARLLPWMGEMTDKHFDGSRLHHFGGTFLLTALMQRQLHQRGT